MRTGTGAGSDAIMLHSTLHTKKRNSLKLVKKHGEANKIKSKRWNKIYKVKKFLYLFKKKSTQTLKSN